MSRLRTGLVKDTGMGLTAVIPFEHLAMAGGVNIALAQSTMRFISQTTRSLRTLDAESARFVTHAFEAYGGADQRDESIRRDAGHAHVLFEPEPFHADVAITLAAFSMGVCRHFDCAILWRGEASQIKLLAASVCRTDAARPLENCCFRV